MPQFPDLERPVGYLRNFGGEVAAAYLSDVLDKLLERGWTQVDKGALEAQMRQRALDLEQQKIEDQETKNGPIQPKEQSPQYG